MRIVALLAILLLLGTPAFAAESRNSDFAKGFDAAFEEAKGKGIPALTTLAKKLYAAGMCVKAAKCWNEVLAAKPDDQTANKALDRVQFKKTWMTRENRDKTMRDANPGKFYYDSKFMISKEYELSLDADRAKVGWNFDFKFNDNPAFVLYCQGTTDEAFSTRRLVESVFSAFEREFGDSVGMPKSCLNVHVFWKQEEMTAYLSKLTGRAVSTPNAYDPKANASLAFMAQDIEFGRDMVIEAVIRGIIAGLGHNGDGNGLWFHYAWIYYFRMARTGPDSISIGSFRPYQPDLPALARGLGENSAIPDLRNFLNGASPYFGEDARQEKRALAWALFYLLNHEYQGMWKSEFHGFLKGAVKGKSDFKAFNALKCWPKLEKELPNAIQAISLESL
jgi:hypothetical protein